MKYILLIIIRLYWLIPCTYRRKCIFKESCSHYVYKNTHKRGIIGGIKSLRQRVYTCRQPQGFIETKDGQQLVILADGNTIQREQTTL